MRLRTRCKVDVLVVLLRIYRIYRLIDICAKNVSWPWLSPLREWGSLNMAFTGKFVYIKKYIYIYFDIQIYIYINIYLYI